MTSASFLQQAPGPDRLRHRSFFCGVAQMAARWAHNPKVAGSSPAPASVGDQFVGGAHDFNS